MTYPFFLPELPYAPDALAPFMSSETLLYHHGKHMKAYVDNLNGLVKGTPFESLTLIEIIRKAENGIFNNAAQVWNHKYFFDQFAQKPHSQPSESLRHALEKSFGTVDEFKEKFQKAGLSLFGSGWVWLVRRDDKLEILQGSNAWTPVRDDLHVLLTADVWEHAYYIDYKNRRGDYLTDFWKILDWQVIDTRFNVK